MLKDGYYITAYVSIDPLFHEWNVPIKHDQNIALWEKKDDNIRLVHHWEIERTSRQKHHSQSFRNKEHFFEYVGGLLAPLGLTIHDIETIMGEPSIDIDSCYRDHPYKSLTYHSLCHLFSSVMMDSSAFYKGTILALAIDANSDWQSDNNLQNRNHFMGAVIRKGEMECFPVPSPGQYWNRAKKIFGLEEGTLMALATASESVSLERLLNESDIVEMMKYDDVPAIEAHIKKMIDQVSLYTTEDQGVKLNFFDERFTKEENVISMVMKVIQQISILIVERIIKQKMHEYQLVPMETCLAVSGGSALNCPTNTYIMQKYHFKNLMIPPCVNDSGQAIGMGLYYFYRNMECFNFEMNTSYYGDFDLNLEEILQEGVFSEYIHQVDKNDNCFVDDIIEGPLVWFDGRAEIGPRALGHRSILADPHNEGSKEKLNQYKQRQWWRPVAPIIMNEHLDEWFVDSFQSPYMLNNFVIQESKKEKVPAILHLDATARVQSITEKDNERLYKLINRFYERTGVPIICNTSLNDKGEPIINTITQAIHFALNKGITIVYINGNRLVLKNHEQYKDRQTFASTVNFTYKCDDKPHNPYNISINEYMFAFLNISHKYDVQSEKSVQTLKKMFNKASKINAFLLSDYQKD